MWKIKVSDQEIGAINEILQRLTTQYTCAENIDFLNEAHLLAHELPRRICKFLTNFKMTEPSSGYCIISGYPIDDIKIGKTPSHWKWQSDMSSTLEEKILLVLFSSLIGEVFGWSTQQDGHIIHDIFPIKDNENEQLSTGSEQLIWWHTEDAFHPYRGDFIGMLCLRNPYKTPTTIASAEVRELSEDQIRVLFEPRFTIRPDESHLEKNASDQRKNPELEILDKSNSTGYQKINEMNSDPVKVPVLFGDPKSPYARLDPYFMDSLEDDEAQQALNTLIDSIDEKITELVLQPGDFLFIDNYRAVHGRRPFKASYDGNDRWLKRINITRDLRKSRSARPTCTSRIIF